MMFKYVQNRATNLQKKNRTNVKTRNCKPFLSKENDGHAAFHQNRSTNKFFTRKGNGVKMAKNA